MTIISISIGCIHLYIINIGMLDDAGQFIMTPYLEGRASRGGGFVLFWTVSSNGSSGTLCAPTPTSLLQGGLLITIHIIIACVNFYHIIGCAIGFTLPLYSHCFLIVNHSFISLNIKTMSCKSVSSALVGAMQV